MLRVVLLNILICYVSADVCSVENCNEWSKSRDVINVHLVCHTHDDLGWLNTVDQYYWGSNKLNVPVGVQYILNTVVAELERDSKRRFSWAETGFLWRWLSSHGDLEKKLINSLIQKGQLEIIGGGWVQNDEAASHYIDIVDQMAFGLRRLNETFGRCAVPKIAWQIDPFGHSREMGNLFALMGYKGLFFSRYHYSDKAKRIQERSLELLWNTSDDLKTKLFTGTFYADSYGPPQGFCFDALCSDDPIMDNKDMEGYNVDKKVDEFVKYVNEQARHQLTNHVMLLMGSDFQYTNANAWYTNLDKLIEHVNKKQNQTKVHVFYSTPSCYYEAINELAPKLPQKSDDFFPYASGPNSYWTGYFTSRPAFKGFIRQTTAYLQLVKQLNAFAMLDKTDETDLDILRSALALVQHHDAVTGTAKEAVNRDYIRRLSIGWDKGKVIINNALKILAKKKSAISYEQVLCKEMNETICEATRNTSEFTVTAFNPDSHPQNAIIAIPYYKSNANLVKIFYPVIPKKSVSPYQLFVPVEIPAMGFKTLIVNANAVLNKKNPLHKTVFGKAAKYFKKNQKSTKVSNGIIEIVFDYLGHLKSFKNLKTGIQVRLNQRFLYYEGAGPHHGQTSGAYIFRPNNTTPKSFQSPTILQLEKGPIVTEVQQIVSPWISQKIRLFKDKDYLEFEWTIGPIPKEDGNPVTKEVITRYITDIKSNEMFYTDSNGRQIIERKRNYSPTYQYTNTEPVSGNYYPINSRIYLKDNKTQLTILTDRSQGGSSLKDGELELMIHRRAFYDDGYGVAEALNEPGEDGKGLIVRGKHWLIITKPSEAASIHRSLAFQLLYSPILTFAALDKQEHKLLNEFSGLTKKLPPQIKVMTLEKWAGDLLLRLEHIYQNGESDLAKPVKIDLKDLFSTFKITAMRELNLGANIFSPRYSKIHSGQNNPKKFSSPRITDDFNVELTPMEIRTFKITVQPK